MAVDPWNKVDVPPPSASSSCRIPFNAATANIIECMVSACDDVLKLLDSEVLRTEIRVLYEMLYVLNNSFRQHKPFRSIKQVEQCINRLNQMKLQGSLRDLQDLCPNKTQRDEGVEDGHCSVPSQPMLEWLCLKLLGASRLLARTLDQCTKAFILTKRHLRLTEFIVLNMVLTSMLSRLWVFFRGILKALLPVYQGTLKLRQQVARCLPMAYLTDFSLPENLENFLSRSHSDLLKKGSGERLFGIKKDLRPTVLDRLFEEGEHLETGEEEQEMMQMLAAEETIKSSVDLGKAISREGPYLSSSSSGLDINSILMRRHEVTRQASLAESKSSDPALVQQKRTLLKQLRTASSFSEMAIHLKDMIGWCRKCGLRQERRDLAFVLLECQRIWMLDGDEISVQRKRRRLWVKVRRVLFNVRRTALPRSPPSLLRTRRFLRSRFTTLMARYGSIRNRPREARTRLSKDLFGVMRRSSENTKEEPPKEQTSGSEVIRGKVTAVKTPGSEKNEIDDIFSSIGF